MSTVLAGVGLPAAWRTLTLLVLLLLSGVSVELHSTSTNKLNNSKIVSLSIIYYFCFML